MNVKISVEEKGEVARNINIEIPRALFNDRYNSILQRTMSQVQLKGFRPGRAPRDVVKKMYGDRIHNDTLEQLIQTAYHDALEENKLRVVGYPKIDITPLEGEEDVKVTAAVEIYPEPEIKDYFGLKFDVEVETEDADALERELERYREYGASTEAVEDRTTAQDGDLVTVDYEGTIDGKPFEGSSVKHAHVLLGSESFPKSFEEGVVGMELESTKDIDVELPEELANPALAGKEALYKVTLQKIEKRVLPELTDEYVKENKLGESLAELREKMKEGLDRQREQRDQQQREKALFKALLEKNQFEVPLVMVDEEIRTILFESRLLDPQKKESYQVSMERFRDHLGEGAAFSVKRRVALEAVIKKEGVSASDADLNTWLDAEAKRHSATREMVEKAHGLPKSAAHVKEHLTRERALKMILEKATVKEVKASGGQESGKKKSGKKIVSKKAKDAAPKKKTAKKKSGDE